MTTEPTVDELIQQLARVHIEEARIVEELQRARARETRRARVAAAIGIPNRVTTSDFHTGQRVRISNARDERNQSQGTVTRVTASRVHIRTDDGDVVLRAPQNLVRLV